MPGLRAFNFYKALHKTDGNSYYSIWKMRLEGYNLDVVDYLVKLFRSTDLLKHVKGMGTAPV